MTREQIVIEKRYCGFPQWAHGGYVSGLLAGRIGPSVDVTLRKPVPLERPFDLEPTAGGGIELCAEHALFAEAKPGAVEIAAPEPLTLRDAQEAARFFPVDRHRIPGCFVCGPHRPDGLRVFPAPVWERDVVAAIWTPATDIVDDHGHIGTEYVWAALDCTEAWALILSGLSRGGERAVTGSMAARLLSPLDGRDRYVLVGWTRGREGRKLYAGAAGYSSAGELLVVSRTTWIVSTWGADLDPSILEKPRGRAQQAGGPDAAR